MMKYPKVETELLQQQFRHKIVHLAQPQATKNIDNKVIAWQVDNKYVGKHMLLEKLSNTQFYYDSLAA